MRSWGPRGGKIGDNPRLVQACRARPRVTGPNRGQVSEQLIDLHLQSSYKASFDPLDMHLNFRLYNFALCFRQTLSYLNSLL